jgi:hypothetical protein
LSQAYTIWNFKRGKYGPWPLYGLGLLHAARLQILARLCLPHLRAQQRLLDGLPRVAIPIREEGLPKAMFQQGHVWVIALLVRNLQRIVVAGSVSIVLQDVGNPASIIAAVMASVLCTGGGGRPPRWKQKSAHHPNPRGAYLGPKGASLSNPNGPNLTQPCPSQAQQESGKTRTDGDPWACSSAIKHIHWQGRPRTSTGKEGYAHPLARKAWSRD